VLLLLLMMMMLMMWDEDNHTPLHFLPTVIMLQHPALASS